MVCAEATEAAAAKRAERATTDIVLKEAGLQEEYGLGNVGHNDEDEEVKEARCLDDANINPLIYNTSNSFSHSDVYYWTILPCGPFGSVATSARFASVT